MILNVHYMVSLALLFVMFSTGAWRKSYSTFILVLAITVAMYYSRQCEFSIGHVVVNIASLVAVIRSIVHKEYDRLVR